MSIDAVPSRLRVFAASAALSIGSLAPMPGLAEDIDIYSPHPDADFRPKMVIGIDTSASMRFTGDAWAKWRLDRLKDPLVDFLRTTDSVDVGLSAFNGLDQGGAIVAPARRIDQDLCPDDACGLISLRTQVARDADDGFERESSGTMQLTSAGLSLGQRTFDYGSQGRYLDRGGQSYLQTQAVFGETDILPFSTTENGESASIGLHFPVVSLPKGATLTRVTIDFQWAGQEWLDAEADEGSGTAKTLIYLDARKDSPPFADAPGRRVNDRPLTTGPIGWNVSRPANWQGLNDSPMSLRTPNFKDQFAQVFDKGEVGTLTVIIKPDPSASLDRTNTAVYLGNHARDSEAAAPRLVLGYTLTGIPPAKYINGTRFDSVNIPPGARIADAWLEYLPRGGDNDAFLQIRGEDADDAADFRLVKRTLSAREKTAAQVNWSPGSWQGLSVRQRSTDISPIVQEIVDRPGWCAGNAMAMIVEGTGERLSWSYRSGAYRSASLHVSYDPASVDRSRHCTRVTGEQVQLIRSEGDAVQLPDGSTRLDQGVFDASVPSGGSIPRLGLRFPNVDLARGASIADARLLLSVVGKTSADTRFQFTVDDDADAGPYTADQPVTSRFGGDPHFRTAYTPFAAGERVESGDLSGTLQQVIDSPDWTPGSDIYLSVHPWAASPAVIRTALGRDGEGPQLRISTRVKGAQASGLPFRTVRDELIEQVQLMPAIGNTPFVNLFEESARYLLGSDVVHGRRRGEQVARNSVHRLSDPHAYENGSITRPTGCAPDDPGNEACAGETIAGTPTYIAPETSECRANQIVIVTDGSPTPSNASSAPAIRTMTGGACSSADPAVECAVELAAWLSEGGEDRHPIRTSTIGFDFSSDFLDQLVQAGGGRSYSVSNAGQVGEALRRISAGAANGVASFTSPTASVSQYGRASHRSDVYLTQFQPEAGTSLWSGNMKKYALGPISEQGEIGLVDVGGKPVLVDGRIDGSAQSWWSNGPDGAFIDKGGAASRLKLERNLLTHPAPSRAGNHQARELVPFAVGQGEVRAADLGVAPALRDAAIRWMRGVDVLDEDQDDDTAEARRQLGAALHTTASIVNYASSDPGGRSVVFAGTQEGFLHAIDASSGSELFGFLPHELYRNVGPFFAGAAEDFRHGLDGPITTRMSDENGNGVVDEGESAWLTVGMRRGGSHYYTLDITDPANPSLLWTIDPTRPGFEALGQTWSSPVPATIPHGDGSTLREVLVFGSGYRTWNDADTRDPEAEHGDVGAIYIVDALTGELVTRIDRSWHPEMRWSIVADIVAADVDFDGITDLLLAADLGGNVWRIDPGRDTGGTDTAGVPTLSLGLAARLADRPMPFASPTGATEPGGDRRFFHAPDVGLVRFPDGSVRLGVAIGSGRRDRPLEHDTVNRIYMLYLDPAGPEPSADPISEGELFDATSRPADTDSSGHGWFVNLPTSGEKLLGTPLILQNRLIATSYVPPDATTIDPCVPDLGGGRLYTMNIFSGAGLHIGDGDGPERSTELDGVGIPPPVAVYISELSPDKPILLVGTAAVDGAVSTPAKRRTYWMEE